MQKLKKLSLSMAFGLLFPVVVCAEVFEAGAWSYEESEGRITGYVGDYVALTYQCGQGGAELLVIAPNLTRIAPADPNIQVMEHPYFVAFAVDGGDFLEVPYVDGDGLIDVSEFIPYLPDFGVVSAQINNLQFSWRVDGFERLRSECSDVAEWNASSIADPFNEESSIIFSKTATRVSEFDHATLTLVCSEREVPQINLYLGIDVVESFSLSYRYDDSDPIIEVQRFSPFEVARIREYFEIFDIGGLLGASSLRVQFGSNFAEWRWQSLPNEFLECVESSCATTPLLCEPRRPLRLFNSQN